jgi:hypothetical protein
LSRDIGSDYNKGRPLPFAPRTERVARRARRGPQQPTTLTQADIGTDKLWPASDDARGRVYLKNYRLRGVGQHIEVWVAHDQDKISKWLEFPEGDCRNGERTRISDAQIQGLVEEYDDNILPQESSVLSVAPPRTGAKARLPKRMKGIPANYFRGEGDNVVVLVDNVRDENFYDHNNSHDFRFVLGFF